MRLYLPFAGLALALCAFGQHPATFNNSEIRGEVEHEPAAAIAGLIVEVVDLQRHELIERTAVFADGSFTLRQGRPAITRSA